MLIHIINLFQIIPPKIQLLSKQNFSAQIFSDFHLY